MGCLQALSCCVGSGCCHSRACSRLLSCPIVGVCCAGSKEWFQTGKEGSVLCWDCCQQKRGTDAVRPLAAGEGEGGPPQFLFKPVEGAGGEVLNGKHVMRTRRNKEVRCPALHFAVMR